ncbi:MAG TPA: ABC transporter ATP-binding protein [Trueperaceae bacterium]|nr:ABC transporter ATP-binding protein [Trueperaceae bacterium]
MARPGTQRRPQAAGEGSARALAVRGVSKAFGSSVALDDVNLELPGGKLICFLGPSGCGKTTLLRTIAGLETPSSGSVYLGDQDLTALPAHQRNIGMVFQSFALFPHLNVVENVAYGLRIRGVPKPERTARAQELLELVRLPGMGARGVSQLSGGQRQRVAMARALARRPFWTGAVVCAGRQAAQRHAGGATALAAGAWDNDDHRHTRPGGGPNDG